MLLLLNLIFCTETFRIELISKHQYITANTKPGITPSPESAGIFRTEDSPHPGEVNIIEIKTNSFFTLDGSLRLILQPKKTGGENQNFTITREDEHISRIKSEEGLCLTYVNVINGFVEKTCIDDRNQLFEIQSTDPSLNLSSFLSHKPSDPIMAMAAKSLDRDSDSRLLEKAKELDDYTSDLTSKLRKIAVEDEIIRKSPTHGSLGPSLPFHEKKIEQQAYYPLGGYNRNVEGHPDYINPSLLGHKKPIEQQAYYPLGGYNRNVEGHPDYINPSLLGHKKPIEQQAYYPLKYSDDVSYDESSWVPSNGPYVSSPRYFSLPPGRRIGDGAPRSVVSPTPYRSQSSFTPKETGARITDKILKSLQLREKLENQREHDSHDCGSEHRHHRHKDFAHIHGTAPHDHLT